MHKFISIIIPYILAGIILIINFVSFSYKEILLAAVMGLLIGFWFLNVIKTEGTKFVLVSLFITFILFIVGDVISFIYLYDILSLLILCSVLQLFIIYIVSKNKPKLTMSYKYSYKNKRRRYF